MPGAPAVGAFALAEAGPAGLQTERGSFTPCTPHRAALLGLPPDPYLVVARTQRTVARDGFFSFEGRRYAVRASSGGARPGEKVELVVGARELEVRSSRTGRLLASYERGRPGRVLPAPARDSVPLAEVLRALPAEEEVHRRPLSIYEEVVAGG
jgi:hypothetical protein